MQNYTSELEKILRLATKTNVSDVHFSVGHSPIFRIDRKLTPLVKEKKVSSEDTIGFAKVLLNEEQFDQFIRKKEFEFAYEFNEKARFRVNIFFQRNVVSIAMRLIPTRIRTIDELNLPSILHDFCSASNGFVIVTGPSSHGKSTTLAAMIDEINHQRAVHIISIEDPIEYFFEDDQSIVDQREIGTDVVDFSRALRSIFRQDPDVIMLGEMRDTETISTAITAAETGHIVFSTLHTNDAAQAIHRIVDVFPSNQQEQIRSQLSGSLLAVVAQRLIPRIRGGVIPACEIMTATPAISNLIRENKIHEIPMVIETSAQAGMVTLNKSLANLVRAKEISLKTAIEYSLNPMELKRLVGGL